ncbi:MAG TPA: hypothetical protein VK172_00820 [Lentimicrobium sp.]|jgi:heme/copper-type cytochrome/quinol oxidase subunit 4|nr:hypothetical protein [Lentimicrobium sp.]
MNFWRNDNFFVGATVGVVLTVITVLLLMLIVPAVYAAMGIDTITPKILLLAFMPAIFMMRYYMKKLNFSNAGSGMVFIVFLGVILYFLLIANKLETFPSLLN